MKTALNWKWILLGLFILGLFLSSEGSRSYWKRKRHLKELQAKLELARAENKSLALEIQRLENDPRAIEQIARRDLGMIQPGEIEYRFVSESPAPK